MVILKCKQRGFGPRPGTMIYLDNNATTRIADEVLEAMMPFMTGEFGNASSKHSAGTASRKVVKTAREQVAALLGAASPDEIVFTSGGTESDNWAILGALRVRPDSKHIITSAVEHEAVRFLCDRLEKEGCEVTRLGVDSEGLLDLDELRSALRPDTAIVSIMTANNETGVLFPIEAASRMVHEYSDALFHTDAVNAAGKTPINAAHTGVDLLSVSGHKFHAPKGIGALYIRRGVELPPHSIGGGQEAGRRAGTEAVHQIAGLGAAAELAGALAATEPVRALRDRLENGVLASIECASVNGTRDPQRRLANTSNISFEGLNGEMIMDMLDSRGICVSTGSACNDAHHRASATLAAMDVPFSRSMGSIRFSLSRYNTDRDIETLSDELPPIIEKLQAIAP